MAETENTEDLGLDSLEENDVNDYTSGRKDPELEAIKARVREMDKEAKKLKQLSEVEKQMNLVSPSGMTSSPNMSIEEWKEMEVNSRSVYVGNVDYRATEYELEQHFQHFHGCGSINRVTIVCNKHDGHPMGFAYIEFSDKDSVRMAMAMGDSVFRGRQIQIMPKRSNQLGMSLTNRPPRKRLSGRGSVAYGGGHSYGGRRLRHGKRKKKKKKGTK